MPYLGNEAADRFVSQPAVDQFSGDGSTTAFTLSFPVTSDQDILVSVDGVVQDVAAYAVSSGTTLTFTAAPSSNSGNNIFVNYLARTHATVAHPATSALTATTGTFTGAFTSPGIDDNADATAITIDSSENVAIGTTTVATGKVEIAGGIYLSGSSNFLRFGADSSTTTGVAIHRPASNTLAFVTASAEQMRISTDGEITKPRQPSFQARPASTQDNIAINSNVDIVFGTEVFDVGANFASNTFTAPVAGKYFLSTSIRLGLVDSAANYYLCSIVTSNRNYQFIFDPDFGQDANYWVMSISHIADMDASDTAKVQVVQSAGTQQTDIATESTFSGALIC